MKDSDLVDEEYAIKAASILVATYPNQAQEPEIYQSQLIRLFVGRPKRLVGKVADPCQGLVAKSKFLPSIAEVKEWLGDNSDERVGDQKYAGRSNKAKRALELMDKIAKRRMADQDSDWMPSVSPGTPQWQAWRRWRVENELSVVFMDRQGSEGKAWTVCQEWPPVAE